MTETAARVLVALLLGFIAGVAVTAVVFYVFRGRIRARMKRRRGPGSL